MPDGDPWDQPRPAPGVDAAHLGPDAVGGLGRTAANMPSELVAPAQDGAPDEAPRAEDILRARVLGAEAPAQPASARARLTPATLVALVLLVVSAGASLTFVLARGGVALPTTTPSRGPVAGASTSPSAPSAQPASPTVAATSAPTTTAPSTVAPTTAPTSRPSPTSDRYAVLVACPNVLACWTYTIRAGDNLVSVANWFGVQLATIYEMNPGLRTTTIRAGLQIRIPTPTR